MKLIVEAATEAKHPDGERENQDAVFVVLDDHHPYGLLIVADGVGGHHEGALASKTVIETIAAELADIWVAVPVNRESALEYLQDQLRFAVYRAHEAVLEHANQKGLRIASTVTCALIYDGTAVIANVGDSRTYIGHGTFMEQVTRDHSLVAWLVRENQLPAEEAPHHPYRNVIMHALGTPDPPQIDLFVRPFTPQNFIILCSDGIWDSLSDADLISYLQTSTSLAQARAEMMSAAQDHRDDLSLILARFAPRDDRTNHS